MPADIRLSDEALAQLATLEPGACPGCGFRLPAHRITCVLAWLVAAPDPKPCGTYRGYMRHMAPKGDRSPCGPCREASRWHGAALKATRRLEAAEQARKLSGGAL